MTDTNSQAEEIKRLRVALTAITKPEGVYSQDKITYLNNVIGWCIKTAEEALAKAGQEKL